MAVNSIHLRKLLQLLYLPDNKLVTKLREDIRNEITKEEEYSPGGGDFFGPFWSDAKNHVAGHSDLTEQTRIRIDSNTARARLYPQLEKGFLEWWTEKRRWSNEEFEFISERVKGRLSFTELGAVVKIENILALRVGDNSDKLIYPYFSEEPSVNEEAARIGLWVMASTFEKYSDEDMRILDILRGRSFRSSEVVFDGNEEQLLISKYSRILEKWEALKEEY